MRLTAKSFFIAAMTSVAVAVAVWAAIPVRKAVLAADLPPGALLTIESPDFAGLLHTWNASPEQAGWLKSAQYSAFANSRLFNRLSDAQGEFEGVAGGKRGFDAAFLQQVAGKESMFAWYDISKLEFLYITHLPAGKAANIGLLQQRGHFSRRESGGVSFYVRTSTAPAEADADSDANAGPSKPRTIAFATRGDWLLLATREDLMANALLLMEKQANAQAGSSEAVEGWYAAAEAAAPQHGDLHMLLDLQAISANPSFRTYWIQQNVSDTRRYRAAVVDLFRDVHSFREERVLVPNTPTDAAPQPDLAGIESLVPERASVYRATAAPEAAVALAALDEKLLRRTIGTAPIGTSAPAANLAVAQAGSSSDLETRIDAVSLAAELPTAANAPLLGTVQSAGLSAMLTLDRSDPPSVGGLFVPIHSAVVLQSANAWNLQQLQTALLESIRSHLTVGSMGLAWIPVSTPAGSYFSLGATHPFALFVDGNTAILSNDGALMTEMLARRGIAAPTSQPATYIGAFRHMQERSGFKRLSASLAHAASPKRAGPSDDDAAPESDVAGEAPDFFAGSVGSLSDSFRALATERIVERRDGPVTRQTVIYTWSTK